MTSTVPPSLIQLCETHSDRGFKEGEQTKRTGAAIGTTIGGAADTQEQAPRWNLITHSIQPRHPIGAWMWFNDPLFRVSPDQLRQRMVLDATTEWQTRCSTLDFPRTLSKKRALEGFGAMKPDELQAKAAMIAIERYSQDNPLLWILYNETEKTIKFLDEKAFPREGGYKQIWIMREPMWDRLWDASGWSSGELVSWLEKQEDYKYKVEWPLLPATETQKSMVEQYSKMGHNPLGLSRDELRKKLSRAIAVRKLSSD